MVTIEKENISTISLLHIYRNDLRQNKAPLVIFVHGFTSFKEMNLSLAYMLAEKGVRVVLPDALYHGERGENLSKNELNLRFPSIVVNEIKELEMIKEHFEQRDLIDSGKIGVGGTSMGGITTLAALTQYKWIKAAVSLMGSPSLHSFLKLQVESMRASGFLLPIPDTELNHELEQLIAYDLWEQPEKLNLRPLFFWHGKRDPYVPFEPTYQFYQQVVPFYADTPKRLEFIADDQAEHKVSSEGLKRAVEWFACHL
ncbi:MULTISPECIES: alpha/beta fold hydrolase [Bacillus]|uniref:Esterase n=2 Tax=Bacillus TaxID=1386 RepID=A0A0M5J9J1_9BACI|nr:MULTISPECIES: alpha/beta fold hydrolase [Bacillus]ALC80707.1 esterase [Bacillus gobiensis]MBP1079602.1 dienelactone hydrolase [Bacillus capparidis]MED1095003.1 alpha/beta fold hydrolase [Bacillus capparidis]